MSCAFFLVKPVDQNANVRTLWRAIKLSGIGMCEIIE
jgi:hypothetical protein